MLAVTWPVIATCTGWFVQCVHTGSLAATMAGALMHAASVTTMTIAVTILTSVIAVGRSVVHGGVWSVTNSASTSRFTFYPILLRAFTYSFHSSPSPQIRESNL